MRQSDRPGVIYSVTAGVIGQLGLQTEETILLKAAARAASGLPCGAFNDGPKSIGPQRAKIGALPANQDGIVLDVADQGQPAKPNYGVDTGSAGRLDSQTLPLIAEDMRRFTEEQEMSPKSDPSPLDETFARRDALLASIRLRSSSEPMPHLAAPGRWVSRQDNARPLPSDMRSAWMMTSAFSLSMSQMGIPNFG